MADSSDGMLPGVPKGPQVPIKNVPLNPDKVTPKK